MFLSKMRFKTKLIFFICILFLVVAIIQFSFTSLYTQKIIVDKSETYFKEVISQVSTRINAETELKNQLVLQISSNSDVIYHIDEMTNSKKSPELTRTQIKSEVLKLLPPDKELISDLYIFTKSGFTINCFYSHSLDEIDPYSQLLMNRFQRELQPSVVWDDAYLEPDHISCYTPIFRNNKLIAILRLRLKKELLGNVFDNIQLDEDNVILLLDETQNVIYSNKTAYIGNNKKYLDMRNHYEVTSTVSKEGLSVVGFIPHRTVSSEISLLNVVLLILYFSTFLIFIIIATLYMKKISKPINYIVSGMNKIQNGNLDVKLTYSSTDEFGFITETFNEMAVRIKTLIEQIYTYQKASALAQKEALEAKLNPHFLYNTLDSIYWMLIMQDNSKESAMVIKLSNILRYSISHDKELVPIYEDIQQLENYIDLHRIRFHNKLDYYIDIDNAIENISIPKLLLQPLIENSLKYGFKNLKKTGLIKITATAKDDYILFVVYDNGVGIPAEKLKDIFTTGLGLRITHERIQCIYGESYGLEIKSSDENGTAIFVKIGYEPIFTL